MSAVAQPQMTDEVAPETPMPTRVDLRTWDDIVCLREDSHELVEGVPTMAPGESYDNRSAGTLLAGVLNAERGDWIALTDMDVTVRDDGSYPTVRRPDVVVARRRRATATAPPRRLLADEVLLVAEVVSPSSVERDLVTKRREYALAGIPAYLVVDLRAEPGELTLHGSRGEDGRYAEARPSAAVTLTIDGRRIDVDVADLLA